MNKEAIENCMLLSRILPEIFLLEAQKSIFSPDKVLSRENIMKK
jgi:hypothetical protein